MKILRSVGLGFLVFFTPNLSIASIPSDCVPQSPPLATAEIHGKQNCPEWDTPESILPTAVQVGPFEPGLYQIEIISRSCIDYGDMPKGKLYGGRLRIQVADNNQAHDLSEFFYVGFGSIRHRVISHECSRIWEKTPAESNPVVLELTGPSSTVYITVDDSFGGFCGDNSGSQTIEVRRLVCSETKSLPSRTTTATETLTASITITPTVTATPTPTVQASGTRTLSPTRTVTATLTPTPNWALELGLREGDVIGVPNPAINQPVRIWIPLESAARIKVTIYALTGEKIWSTQFHSQAGNASVLWEGLNRAGEAVSGGLYIVAVEIQRPGNRKVYTTRIALVK